MHGQENRSRLLPVLTMNSKKRILVTGANGLVGKHLVSALTAKGHDVLAGFHSTRLNADTPAVSWIHCDIFDVVQLPEIFAGVDTVFHCAAKVSFAPNEKKLLFETNVTGTANVVNACIEAGVKKLLHVSSVAALGRIRVGEAINETMQWTPETSNSFYGETKFKAEQEVWRGMAEGLDVAVVNPVIILGAADWNTGSSAIFKSVYNEFPWYTEGVTGFVDVLDVVKALIAIDEAGITGERFILSAANCSYQNLFMMIAKGFNKKSPHKKVTPFLASLIWRLEYLKFLITGKKPLLTRETALTAQAKSYFDNTKLTQLLPGFTYTPLEASVHRICQEYLSMNPAK